MNTADRDFCKKLRAEEIELRDRNSVLRVSGTGKVNNFQQFAQTVMSEKIRALRKSFDASGRGAQPQQAVAPVGEFTLTAVTDGRSQSEPQAQAATSHYHYFVVAYFSHHDVER